MKQKYFFGLIVTLLISTNQAFASETSFGIGANLNSDSNSNVLYFPIMLGQLILEPSLSYNSVDRVQTDDRNNDHFSFTGYGLDVGFFGTNKISENNIIYYGLRIGYSKFENKWTDSSIVATSTSQTIKDSGYNIAPTFGLQYYFSKNISLGVDQAIQYFKRNSDNTFSGNDGGGFDDVTTEQSSTRSQTRVILRYMFR